jgi:hypothetical protein
MHRTIPVDAKVFRKGTTEPLMQAGAEKWAEDGVLLIECRWIHPEIHDGLMMERIPQTELELAPADAEWPEIPWLDYEIEMQDAYEAGDDEAIQRAVAKYEASGLAEKDRQHAAELLAAIGDGQGKVAD